MSLLYWILWEILTLPTWGFIGVGLDCSLRDDKNGKHPQYKEKVYRGIGETYQEVLAGEFLRLKLKSGSGVKVWK